MPQPEDPAERSRVMRLVKSKDTKPELQVRKAVHAAGFRYRLHAKYLPGNPDLVFPKYKLAVFVHGCFWHWHGCKRSRMPASNAEYWQQKIDRNVNRDKAAIRSLSDLGWTVLVIWECQLTDGTEALLALLNSRRT